VDWYRPDRPEAACQAGADAYALSNESGSKGRVCVSVGAQRACGFAVTVLRPADFRKVFTYCNVQYGI